MGINASASQPPLSGWIPAARGALGGLRAVGAVIALVVLTGCTATPDWADPTRWGEETPAPPTQVSTDGAAQAGTDTFPNLASVPDAPPAVSSPAARATIREGLAADRTNAQYSDERLVGDTRDQAAPAARASEPERSAIAEAPPPPQVAADIPASPPPASVSAAPPPAAAPSEPPLPAPPSVNADSSQTATASAAPDTRVSSVPRRISPRIVERVPAEEGGAESAAPPPPPAAAMPAPPPEAAPATRPEPTESTEPPAPAPLPAAEAPTASRLAPSVTEAQRSEAGLSAAQSAAVQRALEARAARLGGGDVGAEDAAPSTPRTFATPPSDSGARVAQGRPPVAAMTPPPTPAVPSGQSELVGVIYFSHGSASLDPNDRRVLRDIVALHRLRGGVIRLVGHASARTGNADPVAHRVANLEMSQKRASAVAAALVRLGASRADVVAEARADAQPVYHEFMPTGEAGNRRVEIYLGS